MYLSLSLSLYLYLSLYLLKKCERVAVKGCIDQFHAIRLRKCQSTNRKYDIEKYSWWKSRNPSRREASRKGGESSGGPSLGDCDNICEGNLLFRVIFGKFMHRWILICAQLGSYNVSFLNYRPPKLKYGFFRGSFARLTSQSQAGERTPKKAIFQLRRPVVWKKYIASWAHIRNQRCMKFPKITLKSKFPSQMLSQSPLRIF